MNPWSRNILRLSGRAPERKSDERRPDEPPATIFRRFFAALAQMDRRRLETQRPEAEQRP